MLWLDKHHATHQEVLLTDLASNVCLCIAARPIFLGDEVRLDAFPVLFNVLGCLLCAHTPRNVLSKPLPIWEKGSVACDNPRLLFPSFARLGDGRGARLSGPATTSGPREDSLRL